MTVLIWVCVFYYESQSKPGSKSGLPRTMLQELNRRNSPPTLARGLPLTLQKRPGFESVSPYLLGDPQGDGPQVLVHLPAF